VTSTPSEPAGAIDVMTPEPPAPSGDTPVASRRPPWRVVGAAVLAFAVIAVVVWLVWPSSSSNLPAHAPLPPLHTNPVTNLGGQELLATLQKGESATYHLTYTVQGDAQQIGGALTLSVWQSPPNTREDSVLVSKGKTTSTESISTPAGSHLCTLPPGSSWTCTAVPLAQVAAGGAAGIVAAIKTTVSGHGVLVAKRTIGGYAVTCFTIQVNPSEQPQLCTTNDGIPVLISDHDVSYRLASFSQRVDSAVFALPTRI
jgi:hypothetical protein